MSEHQWSEQADFFAHSSNAGNVAPGPARANAPRLREDIPEHPVFGKATGPGVKYFAQIALWPHVERLASASAQNIPPGFTADDVRELAIEHGLATGDEEEIRALSWIGPWLRGLARRGSITHILDGHGAPIKRPSARPEAHGNPQYAYTAKVVV